MPPHISPSLSIRQKYKKHHTLPAAPSHTPHPKKYKYSQYPHSSHSDPQYHLSTATHAHTIPAPAPAPVVEHTAAPVQKPAKADYYVQSIYFDSDQDVPRADQGANLQAALNAANQYKNDQVKLLGNADTDANPQYNIGLSERRVQDVAQYLVNNGVDANRLIGIANGDAKPVATNATANGKAENRRVDVFIHR